MTSAGTAAPPAGAAPDAPAVDGGGRPRRAVPLLFLNVLVIAVCGLVYELLAGAVASYLLGDSVTQFSLVIGLYLSAMGAGAWLSRYLTRHLARRFVEVELAVASIGGLSAPLLFVAFGQAVGFRFVLYLDVAAIGVLVGLELPLLMRILERDLELKELVARVLAFDYLGALFASLLFPLVLVPHLGLVRTAFAMGIVNALVALWGTSLLADKIERGHTGLRVRAVIVIVVLLVGLVKADALTRMTEEQVYANPVLWTKTTAYQRIVVTGDQQGFALYLNGNLQLHSADEYRYHEALVHPAMLAAARAPRRVLVLGGGDGLALREIFRHPGVEHVTLVDIDPAMTGLADAFAPLAALNGGSFHDPRLQVVNDDAFVWLERREDPFPFDVAIVDLPDPNHFALGKLYTRRFYALLARAVAVDGSISVQSTSPLFARRSFWTIVATLEAAGWRVRPYQATVPSFGVWGFALARRDAPPIPRAGATALGLRSLDDASIAALFALPPDMSRPAGLEVNRLDNQILVHTYEDEVAALSP